jgi:glycosyltransferase involved in cell wall biosynthesis
MTISLSVIIPCYNEEHLLPKCLDHILAQEDELGSKGEIIIAINGSTDRSLRIAESYSLKNKKIKVIKLSKPHKKAAMNAALKLARNRYVIFNDADSFLDSTALNEVKKYYSCDEYAIIGAVRRPLLDENKVNVHFIETYYTIHYAKRLSLKDRLSVQGWFMAIDRNKLKNLTLPLDAAADDIWLSAHVWSSLGPSAIGYIPHAIGSYIPPSTIEDMKKQILRHRSNHRVVQSLHPELSDYFVVRKVYYNDIHIGDRWKQKAIELNVDFSAWIMIYEEFVASIEAEAKLITSAGVTWERVSSSKSLPNK